MTEYLSKKHFVIAYIRRGVSQVGGKNFALRYDGRAVMMTRR
jgi:hypothetical protein